MALASILDIHVLQLFTDPSHIFGLVNTSYLLSQGKFKFSRHFYLCFSSL